MPDYKEMYLLLFRETTKAIRLLQKAQQTTEDIFISGDYKQIKAVKTENYKRIINIKRKN